jgi:hypothetical protein
MALALKQTLQNNGYSARAIINTMKKQKNRRKGLDNEQNTKWAKFTYTGRETLMVTKLFKKSHIIIAFTTTNNLGRLLKNKSTQDSTNKFKLNGVYQLNCPTCNRKYIGQMGSIFHIRYREHYNDYKYANNKSKFAEHVREEDHTFGPMEEIMKPVQIASKGRLLDVWEKYSYYIFQETKNGNQINDKLTVQYNPIFDVLV